ncbi:N-acetylmuramidase domain-containing protein [Dickeya dadantii]|uniref:N-acetylmuramidase domain-containing protein n=1 Tax=Dickeya dadantii TaxID=204038 RepID=UPI000A42C44C|nr:N-acetylmuramidase domain-containing protein [Dickeya dadantii]
MGRNYKTAGFDDIESFVSAMKSINGQAFAFINHIKNTPALLTALQNKDWEKFARLYNGPDYKRKEYDVIIRNNYNTLTGR